MPTNVYEQNIDKVDMVSGGDVSVVIVKEYIGVPVTIGGYGFAVCGNWGIGLRLRHYAKESGGRAGTLQLTVQSLRRFWVRLERNNAHTHKPQR